jgi:predicted DNA-binding transcriptional regulator YafY
MPVRMLRLLSLLQSRREWSGTELSERLGVTLRTVRRDINRLRELGYPVEGTRGTAGGYRLAPGTHLPPLLLDDDEAVAVAVGLLTAAGGSVTGIEESSVRALTKLEQILPVRLRHQIAAVGDATIPVVHRSGPQADPTTLAVLAAACRDHEVVRFDYQDRDGMATSRRVEPYSLVTMYGKWYVVAYDPDRAGWRGFRLDRLTQPTPTRRRFTPRELPAIDAAAYLARSITAAPYRYTARATVHAPASSVRARMYAPIPGEIEPLDAGTCTVRLAADSLDLLAQPLAALATLGSDLTIEASRELLDHLRTAGQRLLDSSRQPRTQ